MSAAEIDTTIARNRRRGLLIDTNLYLLLLIGGYDVRQISMFRRTRHYTRDDYDVVQQLAGMFDRLVTTPHIQTEVSNLSAQFRDERRSDYFQRTAAAIAALDERYRPSAEVVRSPHFARFGLADAAIVQLAPDTCLVLTDDFPLANLLATLGIDVLNFNHLRTLRWGLS